MDSTLNKKLKPQLDHYKCSGCGMRYAEVRKECFYCGKSDTIKFDQIKKAPKKKSTIVGSTLNINVRSK